MPGAHLATAACRPYKHDYFNALSACLQAEREDRSPHR